MPLKAASALIAFLQAASSLAVLEIVFHMFCACEWPWIKYAAKRRTNGPIYICVLTARLRKSMEKSYIVSWRLSQNWKGSEIKH